MICENKKVVVRARFTMWLIDTFWIGRKIPFPRAMKWQSNENIENCAAEWVCVCVCDTSFCAFYEFSNFHISYEALTYVFIMCRKHDIFFFFHLSFVRSARNIRIRTIHLSHAKRFIIIFPPFSCSILPLSLYACNINIITFLSFVPSPAVRHWFWWKWWRQRVISDWIKNHLSMYLCIEIFLYSYIYMYAIHICCSAYGIDMRRYPITHNFGTQ